jgi:hypothetical protein
MRVDLNCDMGELEDAAHDAALMECITSANIACGGHAGDDAIMERTARLAVERGVRIGAHPRYPDCADENLCSGTEPCVPSSDFGQFRVQLPPRQGHWPSGSAE